MAARKNKGTKDSPWDEKTRSKIQTSMLLNRLLNHCLTKEDDKDYKQKYMQQSQVNAALGLMKKVLPDLTALQLSGDQESPFLIKDISSSPYEGQSSQWLESNSEIIEGETVQ